MTRDEIPSTMRALQLPSYDGVGALRVVERSVPTPKPSEVLVRVLTSPVNPSDSVFCQGLYGIRRPLPTIPGFEGCGVVVAGGGSWMSRWLVGRRVACGAQGDDGMWAEYAAVPALGCLPLPSRLTDEQGASALVNPVSAWAMFDQFRSGGHAAMIQTAAASQLGRMVLRLGIRYRSRVVHVVHRPELVDLLKGMGAEYVLDTSAAGFDEELTELSVRLRATFAIDAVGGETTRRVLNAMPTGKLVVYGALSGEPCHADPRDFIFQDKRIEGFWLSQWMRHQNPILLLWRLRGILGMLDSELASHVAVRLSLEQAAASLEGHLKSTSKGKVLIVPPT